MLNRLLPEWRKRWIGVEFSVAAVAERAGLAKANVLYIVTGDPRGLNPGIKTVDKIRDALDELRDRCPHCYRKGLSEALKEIKDGPDREVERNGGPAEASR